VKLVPVKNPPDPWSGRAVEYLEEVPAARLTVYEDTSREILSRNNSPDLGFRYSINPYRGCTHACAYCYARPTHEYLSFGAGTDFDTRIVAKLRAPDLLREAFERPSWKGESLMFSGVTDCYQPLEASLQLTRGCLEICAEYRNPAAVITKSPLIERDVELLTELHARAALHVVVSIPFLKLEVAQALEPRVATPQRRLRIIERLAQAGIPVGINVAPLVPGLEEDMARLLELASGAGARWAGYVLLRLPGAVKGVFEERLREALPLQAGKVLHRLRETRGGNLYDPRFGVRGRGEGPYAESMAALFQATCRRLGLNSEEHSEADVSPFQRPAGSRPQLSLFGPEH
jgi:DNA repair photolyase